MSTAGAATHLSLVEQPVQGLGKLGERWRRRIVGKYIVLSGRLGFEEIWLFPVLLI